MGAELHPAIAAALAAGKPTGAADLTRFLPAAPRRFNQGRSSFCAFHSASTAEFIAFGAAGRPLARPSSPLYFGQCVYASDRAAVTPEGKPLDPLQDTGTDLETAASVFAKWGSVPMQAPQQDGNTDVPATSDDAGNPIPVPEATAGELQAGTGATFGGEYAIQPDSDAPSLCAAALDAGVPIWIGGPVNAAYEQLGPNDIAQPSGPKDPGHAQAIAAYRTASSGQYEYLVIGSWGEDWALDGTVWASTAFLLSQWSIWPFAVHA